MPAVRRAAAVTKGRVGVIGTRGTVGSGIYERKMKRYAPNVEVHSVACPLFVPLVEEGWSGRQETISIAKEYLRPLRLSSIDTLILGCTHYPFLRSVIVQAIGDGVNLIDPAHDTVGEVAAYLKQNPILDKQLRSRAQNLFYVSDRTEQFTVLAREWLETKVGVRTAEVG
jgi:glutamate racemase